jgi:hypothetical protein
VKDKFPEVAVAKATFPGATVQAVRHKRDAEYKVADEEIPF